MSKRAESVMEVLQYFARVPRGMATSPDEANGMVVAFAAVVLSDATGKPIGASMRDVSELIREAMNGVYPSNSIVPCLADEGYPNRNRTFESFQQNFREFLKLLETRTRPTDGTPDN